jgi:hypothetical protein
MSEQPQILAVSEDVEGTLGFTSHDLLSLAVSLIDRIHPHDADISERLFSAEALYHALQKRHPRSRTHGRPGTPAEVVLRMLLLKHIRDWSFVELEREVRRNLLYRELTRIGAEKVPDAKTLARLAQALGPGRGRLMRGCPFLLFIVSVLQTAQEISRRLPLRYLKQAINRSRNQSILLTFHLSQ